MVFKVVAAKKRAILIQAFSLFPEGVLLQGDIDNSKFALRLGSFGLPVAGNWKDKEIGTLYDSSAFTGLWVEAPEGTTVSIIS